MSKLQNAFTLASIVVATAACGLTNPASAQDLRYIGTHGAWSSFRFTEAGNPVCYIASKPTQMQPTNVRHGDVYLLVTDRPAENSSDVVSLMVGYPYKSGATRAAPTSPPRSATTGSGCSARATPPGRSAPRWITPWSRR